MIDFLAEAYSEPYQTSKMKLFEKIHHGFQPFTLLAKSSILNVWQDPECASPKSGLYHNQVFITFFFFM